MAAYKVEIDLYVPFVFAVYYIVYWSFFMVLADRLAARHIWLALIPGIKMYLLRENCGSQLAHG
ncbi:MAG: hypothetical protein C4536_16155 [Actinobacteria bacterium]|jgi:hypothetical protein|nr:MAG: hypothetical protein C4536_16155 [Actinomycetota bacterium]